jgi:hypothetical protein
VTAVNWGAAVSLGFGGARGESLEECRAGGSVRRRAAPSRLLEAVRRTALRMVGANAANTRNCTKSAVSGGTQCCTAHGGGKRCKEVGCAKSALGDTEHCIAHGGGMRCQHAGCLTAARPGTLNCIAHGEGRRCKEEGCTKSA